MRDRLRDLWLRLRGTIRRDALERDVEEEFRFHLDQATARNLARGLPPDEARRQARLSFGGVAGHREAASDEQRHRWLEGVARDIRYAGRTLRRSPGFTVAALLTVALGIGATTAIFSVINGVLLRPLPFPDPGRLAWIGWQWAGGGSIPHLSLYQAAFLRDHGNALDGVASYQPFESVLGDAAGTDIVRGLRVSQDFFRVTRVTPAAGRAFDEGEHDPGAADVVVVSEAFWRTRLGGDPETTGRVIRLDDRDYTIVGVMPAGFHLPDAPASSDMLVPLRVRETRRDEGQNHAVLARIAPGVSGADFAAELAGASRRFRDENPDLAGPTAPDAAPGSGARYLSLSFGDAFAGDIQRTLWVLFGSVALVTLIACVNTANLLLVRAAGREREIAVRAAIGAGRGRIVRQLLIESLLLSLGAGLIGLSLGLWGVDALLALAPRELPRATEIGLDWRVVAFSAGLSVVTGLAFGLTGSLPAMRAGPLGVLGRAGRGGGREGRRARDVLIVGETALAVVLLAASGLLLTSFARLQAVDPGFEPAGVATVRVGRMPGEYRQEGARLDFERRALERIRALPGVEAAAVTPNFPFERGFNLPMTIAGRPEESEGAVEFRAVSPGYFETLRIPLRRGRGIVDADDEGSLRVVVLNAAMAERYWPGENPIGRQIEIGRWRGEWISPGFAQAGTVEVVGVSDDVREVGLDRQVRRTVYVPRAQWGGVLDGTRFLVRTARAGALGPLVEDTFRDLDPRVPPPAFGTMTDLLGASIAGQRFQTVLLAGFAGTALLLTAIGIYGVVASTVRQRVREIGIRMALGAPGERVVRLILGRSMALVLGGTLLGLLGALASSRLLAGMLYGVAPTDAQVLLGATAVLAAVALVAAWLPARRATLVDPTEALRSE